MLNYATLYVACQPHISIGAVLVAVLANNDDIYECLENQLLRTSCCALRGSGRLCHNTPADCLQVVPQHTRWLPAGCATTHPLTAGRLCHNTRWLPADCATTHPLTACRLCHNTSLYSALHVTCTSRRHLTYNMFYKTHRRPILCVLG
jgi:hypothetical protein